MLFNSVAFLAFFPIVIGLHFIIPHRFRWVLLLAASYYFYMCWSIKFVSLILISTVIDYYAGILMSKQTKKIKRKKYLILSLVMNLGLLAFFKYFNFFNDAFNSIATLLHIPYNVPYLNILLPVGISFYTFQTLSYTIDVYRGKRGAEHHFGYFALYVSFFPQLVAGPIERSTRLLPQFYQKHSFEYQRIADGLKLMAWGFFQKVVIADRLAVMVSQVYNNVENYSGFTLLLASWGFAFQIFCDFAGYSNIAIGSAQVMGFKLMTNFKRPFFAISIADFWQRWHISLTTWFRDYLFIPMSRGKSKKRRLLNIVYVFLICGLWHGANWTYVVWGGIHGFYQVFGFYTKKIRKKISSKIFGNFNKLRLFYQMIITFNLGVFALIFFRSQNFGDALYIIRNIFTIKANWFNIGFDENQFVIGFWLVIFLYLTHLLQSKIRLRNYLSSKPLVLKFSLYIISIISIFVFGVFNHEQFIYFQF